MNLHFLGIYTIGYGIECKCHIHDVWNSCPQITVPYCSLNCTCTTNTATSRLGDMYNTWEVTSIGSCTTFAWRKKKHWKRVCFSGVGKTRVTQKGCQNHENLEKKVIYRFDQSSKVCVFYLERVSISLWSEFCMIIHVQWKLGITRSLGPRYYVCYIRYFVISVVNKQYKTKEINLLGPEKLVYYIRYFVISDLYISSFHCMWKG